MRNNTFSAVALAVATCLGAAPAAAASRELVVEGFLSDTNGSAIPDGPYSATVRLCTAQTAGSCPWDDTPGNISTRAGYFQVRLGGNPDKPLTDALFASGTPLWLELRIGTETYPRTPLASVPYAFRASTAGDAGTVGGFAAAGTPTAGKLLVLDANGRVPVGAVPTPSDLLCSGCVDASDLKSGAIDFSKLNGTACGAGQVITWSGSAFSCQDTAKVYTVGDGITITNLNQLMLVEAKVAEYAKNACYDNASELTAALPTWDTIEGDDVRDNDPASGDLTGTYPGPSIAPSAVSTVKLADGAVATSKLAAGAVTAEKLGADVSSQIATLQSQVQALQAENVDLKARTPQGTDFFLAATSATKLLINATWAQMTGASVTLTPGEWVLHSRVKFKSVNGSAGFNAISIKWTYSTGVDTGVAPPDFETPKTGVVMQSPYSTFDHGFGSATLGDVLDVSPMPVRVKVTSPTSVFVVPAAQVAGPGNGLVTAYIYAERLR